MSARGCKEARDIGSAFCEQLLPGGKTGDTITRTDFCPPLAARLHNTDHLYGVETTIRLEMRLGDGTKTQHGDCSPPQWCNAGRDFVHGWRGRNPNCSRASVAFASS
jgi:hypothetical protein